MRHLAEAIFLVALMFTCMVSCEPEDGVPSILEAVSRNISGKCVK